MNWREIHLVSWRGYKPRKSKEAVHLVLSMQVTGRQASLLKGCGGWVQSYPTEVPKIINVFMPVILLRNVLIIVEFHCSFYCIYLINRRSQVFYAMNDFYVDRVGKKPHKTFGGVRSYSCIHIVSSSTLNMNMYFPDLMNSSASH